MALSLSLEAELPDVRAENEGNTYLFTHSPNLVQADKLLKSSLIPDLELYMVFWLYLFLCNTQESEN